MTVLRDIFRRRLRSVLTIAGVAVGIFALVVLGAIAEKANARLQTSVDYYRDKIVVTEKRAAGNVINSFGSGAGRPLTESSIAALRAHPGVLDVAPQVVMPLDAEALPVGTPSSIAAGFVGTSARPERWKLSEGRLLDEDESGVAVVGSELVKRLGAEVGGRVNVRGRDYEVVGIAAVSNTMFDNSVLIPLADGRKLLTQELPPVFARSVEASSLVSQATVYVKPGVDANDLAMRLDRDVAGIHATGPAGLRSQLGQTLGMYSALLAGAASVALLIGCLSVVNTMMMSLSERNREVGLKRAFGASRWRIGRDVLLESVAVGGLGGLLGLAAACFVAVGVNAAASGGADLFLVTGRLAFGALVFAAVLGGVGGLYPAWRTAHSDPVALLASR